MSRGLQVVTQININAPMAEDGRAQVERQLNFSLASVHWQILQLELTLERGNAHGHEPESASFVCHLCAKLRGGRRETITAQNKDPRVCVSDAAARLRRVIARDRQLGLFGRAS